MFAAVPWELLVEGVEKAEHAWCDHGLLHWRLCVGLGFVEVVDGEVLVTEGTIGEAGKLAVVSVNVCVSFFFA